MVTCIESAIEYKDIAQRAFDRTSFDIIKQAAEKHGIETTICRWTCAVLESRNIIATLSGKILGASAARGCPQRMEVCFRLYCGAWSWRIFFGNSATMAITQ
jgi:hypothetical protein